MPDLQDFFLIGKVAKAHGIKGELKVFLDTNEPHRYLDKKVFFIQKGDTLTPLEVEYMKPFQRAFLLKFSAICDRSTAEALVNAYLYLPISELPSLERDNQFYYHEVIGARVIDERYQETGTVREILEMPAQDLLVILYQGKEILMPIADETIIRWDRNQRILYTRFPVGLREIYLE